RGQRLALQGPVLQVGGAVAGDVLERGVRTRLPGLVLAVGIPGAAYFEDAEPVHLQSGAGGAVPGGARAEGRGRVGLGGRGRPGEGEGETGEGGQRGYKCTSAI